MELSLLGGVMVRAAVHDTDTDILADVLARIVAKMSACRATSPFSLPQE